MSRRVAVYVLGTEGCGKSDLLHQLTGLNDDFVNTKPTSLPATGGLNIRKLSIAADGSQREVELREMGGSMLPVWHSFIKSRVERESEAGEERFGLIYVVDAAAPHTITPARYGFQWLKTAKDALCKEWPTVVVLQKCGAPNAVTLPEVTSLLDIDDAPHTEVLEVDSWNGVGLGDVLDWIKRLASMPMIQRISLPQSSAP